MICWTNWIGQIRSGLALEVSLDRADQALVNCFITVDMIN